MEDKKIPIKEYKKDDLTIIWDANKCIHAGVCVQMLPKVYDPKAKPWVKPENASKEQLIKQLDQCPSGALSYRVENTADELASQEVKIHARMNGSLLVEGDLIITKPDGTIEKRHGRATFCRCGNSANMPFCDGSHKKTGFTG